MLYMGVSVVAQKLERRAGGLCMKYPELGESIQLKQKEALDNWERLEDLANARYAP